MLLAFSNTSAIRVVWPMATASSAVRTNPSMRETVVPAAMIALAAARPFLGRWEAAGSGSGESSSVRAAAPVCGGEGDSGLGTEVAACRGWYAEGAELISVGL
ncbi:hypothetical protein GCM10023354_12720 [Garicola koreensis]